MFRKILALTTMLCVLPIMAHAWTLNTWVKSQGGTMVSSNLLGANQTVLNGSVSKSYTTTGNEVVTVTPDAGFKVSALVINGITQTVGTFPSLATPEAVQTVTKPRTGTVRVYATFARQTFALAAVAGADGSVNTASISPVYVGSQSPAKTFIFTPTPGFAVTGIAASAGVNNVDYQFVNAMTNLPTSLGVTNEKVKVNVVNVPGSITFTATFAGASTAPETSSASCDSCHKSQGVGVGIYEAWSSSKHRNSFHQADCASCHIGANTGSHPGSDPKAACVSCHAGPYVAHDGLYSTCTGCHNPHSATVNPEIIDTLTKSPHKGGAPFHKAQYVSDASLPVSCANCHGAPVSISANQAILEQYAQSAHADPAGEAWLHFDWRGANRSACARCHNGSAFVAKLGSENNTTNVFANSDVLKPGEVLNCSACHTDTASGAIRSANTQFTINMRNGATASYSVVGASALCARCHSGRETGASITADPSTTGVAVFADSHYLPVAGTLYNNGGYEYAGQSYDGLGSHDSLNANGQGPCVTCHMPGKNHTFAAVSCASCHDGTPTVVDAATLKANYDTALNNLKLALAAKGIHYGPVHPFFFTAAYVAGSPNTAYTNWGTLYGAGAWKDTMGAAYNFNMLWSEKGAYAHNYNYAMKLIADSIDFINDGSL